MAPRAAPAGEENTASAPAGSFDGAIWGALVVFALFMSRIAVAQTAYGAALLIWIVKATKERGARATLVAPPALAAFATYTALTLASSFLSVSPRISLVRMREVALYGITFLLVNHVASRKRMETLVQCALLSGTVLSVWGIAQYAGGANSTENRIRGPLTHWMTYSGIVVLTATTAMAYAAYHPCARRRIGYAAVALCASTAVALSLTRGAYIALTVALVTVVALRKPLLVLLIPVGLLLFVLLAPQPIRTRLASMYFLDDKTSIDRMYLWRSGFSMIADHPIFGVGLGMVGGQYESYRSPNAPKTVNPHLHNNLLQIAAERGIPALVAWLWFFGAIGWSMVSRLRHKDARSPALVAGFLALVAFQTFGLGEYNSGDSEVEMMLLFLLSLPFVDARLGAPVSEPATVGLK
ncbi:MAG: O-antigen ligase family protein [Acidobacteriota bacterium]